MQIPQKSNFSKKAVNFVQYFEKRYHYAWFPPLSLAWRCPLTASLKMVFWTFAAE